MVRKSGSFWRRCREACLYFIYHLRAPVAYIIYPWTSCWTAAEEALDTGAKRCAIMSVSHRSSGLSRVSHTRDRDLAQAHLCFCSPARQSGGQDCGAVAADLAFLCLFWYWFLNRAHPRTYYASVQNRKLVFSLIVLVNRILILF